MRRFFITILLTILSVTSIFAKGDRNSDIVKNLDIYNALYKELDMYYVDSIQPEKLIKTSIDRMLSSLDPYTVYLPEEDMNDFKFLTTGEYGGIGAVIMKKNDYVVISEPYEGMPAQKADLHAGDIILKIDGEDMKGKNTQDVSEKLKGTPNTTVKITISRPGKKKSFDVEVTREKIQINPVTYYGVVGDKIGYINLSSFTSKSSDEVRKAFLTLKKENQIESLILDLRNNGGGILDEAVNIINFFVDKGVTVVSTKGKIPNWDKTYTTTKNPIDTKIPLVILVNENSASASEIVTGALQDLDRAVIIGNRTYGKGLVQSTRPLPYGGNLKVTIAKYYIPSGRLIQEIDYSQKNSNGKSTSIPDSLTHEFKTKNGRIVRDGRGINPDITVKEDTSAFIMYKLTNDLIIFDYVTEYCLKHDHIGSIDKFVFTDEDFNNFVAYVKSKDIKYELKSPEYLKRFKDLVTLEGYDNIISEELKAIEEKLKPDLDHDLLAGKKDLCELLSIEIVERYYHHKGAIKQSLKNDKTVDKAVETLKNIGEYNKILGNNK